MWMCVWKDVSVDVSVDAPPFSCCVTKQIKRQAMNIYWAHLLRCGEGRQPKRGELHLLLQGAYVLWGDALFRHPGGATREARGLIDQVRRSGIAEASGAGVPGWRDENMKV